ncbi:putative methyltransferase (plasmid) [Gordonia polyisoprenivorans VH2]|uniref:Putative methyltransferase n=1 Tax=Gordonia polyisoprenivorans (strain DSM 44266 / VH2) TaxID=1112204 RepID=H6N594_GORPV|nr:class I SAM-dependent methyltransferase [Gordonia polyisoprenivorans]AFA76139.1 putative methyltransferase [Gordonia polyisoprenivorans VH2]
MTRWDGTAAPRGDEYDDRWSSLAAAGENVHGEADLVADLARGIGGRRILDAGCGTGRVAIELARRGFEVVGVDADPSMLATAQRKAGDIRWLRADLSSLDAHLDELFDLVVLAGNVMIFLTPGTEAGVLRQCASRLRPGGLLVAGFQLRPDRLTLSDYDIHALAAGLEPVARFATWDRRPFDGGEYAVSVHSRPADA